MRALNLLPYVHALGDASPSSFLGAQKVITTGTCVRDHALILAPTVGEDHPIRPRTSTSINMVAVQDGEFLVRLRTSEREAFIIIVRVRILVRANCLTFLEV